MSVQGPGKPGFSVAGALSSASLEDVVTNNGEDGNKTRVCSETGSEGGSDDAKLRDLEAPKGPEPSFSEKDSDLPDPDEQSGVKRVEAVTLTWSKKQLYLVYANMWLIYCVNAFQNSVTQNLSAYVTSEFGEHSLLPVAYIVASAISAAVYLPTAKILDIFGRAEGFAFMASIATLGLILTAACKDVQTFAAAQTFYSVGFGGMIYCVDVITADTSTLKHRGFAYAFTSSPYIITAFAGPPIAESAYYHFNWRWGYGIFSIILPAVALPMVYILKHTEKLAKEKLMAVAKPSQATGTRAQKLWYYLVEFDVLGVLLFAAGLTIFLLPFTLADSAPNGWSSGYIIAMLVLGFVMLISFAFFERYFAKVPCLPFGLLTSRTIFATVMLDATVQVAYYCWNNYYTSFLQVVYDVSITNAGYVGSTYDVVSGIWLFIVGILIAKTGYFKWLLIGASLIYTFAIGLMIHFRTQYTSIGYLFMCQVFIAFGASTVILVQQVSVLAASDHQHTAAVLALLNVFGWLGGSIGSTISGAIWTNTFENAIIKQLPDLDLETVEAIYSDITVQLSYPVGDPIRTGLIAAYGECQRYMLIAGVCICATTLPWALLIKNINVSKIRQMKGTLF